MIFVLHYTTLNNTLNVYYIKVKNVLIFWVYHYINVLWLRSGERKFLWVYRSLRELKCLETSKHTYVKE